MTEDQRRQFYEKLLERLHHLETIEEKWDVSIHGGRRTEAGEVLPPRVHVQIFDVA